MTDTWLPLRGPNERGMSPKACPVPGWNEPAYKGVELQADDGWYGLRLESYVVVDCDTADAAGRWLDHIGHEYPHTFVRQTPHGFHYYYRRTPTVCMIPAQKLLSIAPKLELKCGYGHQVVYHAPGYSNITAPHNIIDFDPQWEPSASKKKDRPVDEWSEVPDGIGDNFMISVAGKFREWGMDGKTIEACLSWINKTTMTQDPMPKSSITRISHSAAKFRPGASA